MKKKIFTALVLIIITIFFFFRNSKFLKKSQDYSIVNEYNKSIPAKIYYRVVDVEVAGKKENVYELVVFFDKKLKMEINPIVIVPKYKLIGLAESGDQDFIKFGNRILQLSEKSNKFTTLDSPAFFDNPPIKKKSFEGKTITFNSFEGLTKYGKYVMLKKQ